MATENGMPEQFSKKEVSSAPFFIVASWLTVAGIAVAKLALPDASASQVSWQLLGLSVVLLLASAVLYVYPYVLDLRIQFAYTVVDSLRYIEEIKGRIENDLRSYSRLLEALRSIQEGLFQKEQTLQADVARAVQEVTFALKSKEEQLQETRRGAERLNRDIELWVETAEDYMDYLQRVHEVCDDVSRPLVQRVFRDFMRYVERNGVSAINPEPNSPFVPELQECVGDEPATDGVMAGHVLRCEQLGYSLNGEVLRKAKVVIASHTEENTASGGDQ